VATRILNIDAVARTTFETLASLTVHGVLAVPTAVRYVVDKSGEVIAETRYLPISPQSLEQAGGD
jgi:hypothetical protein